MPTNLYFNNQEAPYIPATWKGSWNSNPTTGVRSACMLDNAKFVGSNTFSFVAETSNTTRRVALIRGVSRKLAAQTINLNLDMVLGVNESAADADFYTKIYAYITQGDSDLVRGVLLDYEESSGTGTEWPTTSTGKAFSSPQTVASVAAQEGDRLVIEFGYIAYNTTTSSRSGTVRFGTRNSFTADSDLTVGSTSTSTLAGFIQYSGTLTLSATEPTNVTPETAIDITSLPYDSGAINPFSNFTDLWFKITGQPDFNGTIGLFAGVNSPTGSYTPIINCLYDNAGTIDYITGFPQIGDQFAPLTLKIQSSITYYFWIESLDTDPVSTRSLIFSAVAGPEAPSSFAGNILISVDVPDSSSSPSVTIDPDTGEITYLFYGQVPAENGVVLDNGIYALANRTTLGFNQNDPYIYNTDNTFRATANTCIPSAGGNQSLCPLATDGTYFYIAQYQVSPDAFVVTKFDQDGTILDTWNITPPTSWTSKSLWSSSKGVKCIAITRDATILYLTNYTIGGPILAYNLETESFLSDLMPDGYYFDINVLSNDKIIYVEDYNTFSQSRIRVLSSIGSIELTIEVNRLTDQTVDHIAPDRFDTTYVQVWMQLDTNNGFTSKFLFEFRKYSLVNGALITTLDNVLDSDENIGFPSENADYPANNIYFGAPNCCPLLILGERGGPIPPPIPGGTSGIYKLIPYSNKSNDSAYLDDETVTSVKIPDPLIKTAGIGD